MRGALWAVAALLACRAAPAAAPAEPAEPAADGPSGTAPPTSGPPGVDTTSASSTNAATSTSAASSESGTTEGAGDATAFVVRGATVLGHGDVDIEVREGRIVQLGDVEASTLEVVDASGAFVAPAFVDSHVHLAYAFDAPTLAAGGVAAAVDLAAPIETLAADPSPLRLVAAGPMITAVGGYPTQSWGADGYGLEVGGPQAAANAVDDLVAAGAGVIKVPLGGGPTLTADELASIVDRAHHHGLKVAAHALTDDEARRAFAAGTDVLAHTPVEPLHDVTVAAWAGGAVISTLGAFGGSPAAVDNLRRLHEAGATVLYGTDLGNSAVPAIDAGELALLHAAGLDDAEVLAAGTSVPAAFWGFDGLGSVAEGAPASFIICDDDPRDDADALARPQAVFIDGRRLTR